MVFLFYAFILNGQLMFRMAEFETMARCEETLVFALPLLKAEYPGGYGLCIPVKKPIDSTVTP